MRYYAALRLYAPLGAEAMCIYTECGTHATELTYLGSKIDKTNDSSRGVSKISQYLRRHDLTLLISARALQKKLETKQGEEIRKIPSASDSISCASPPYQIEMNLNPSPTSWRQYHDYLA